MKFYTPFHGYFLLRGVPRLQTIQLIHKFLLLNLMPHLSKSAPFGYQKLHSSLAKYRGRINVKRDQWQTFSRVLVACLKQSTSKVTHPATMSSQNASVVPLTTASMHGLHIQTLAAFRQGFQQNRQRGEKVKVEERQRIK